MLVYVGSVIRYVNSSGARLVGASGPDALVGRSLLELVAPDERDELIARMRRSAETGAYGMAEQTLMRLDTGARVFVEVSAVPTSYVEDGVARDAVQATIRDITARRRAEADLRESEMRFRGVLDNLRAPAVQLDVAGLITFANDALLRLVGWSRAEVLGTEWFERLSPQPEASRAFFRAFPRFWGRCTAPRSRGADARRAPPRHCLGQCPDP